MEKYRILFNGDIEYVGKKCLAIMELVIEIFGS